MNSGDFIQRMKLQNKPRSRDRRSGTERPPTYGHATYTYKEGHFIYTVEGILRDLSKTGCSIRGTVPQVVGSRIRISLSLRDQHPPLCLNGAIVSWVAGDSFGVKFGKLNSKDFDRLQQHIHKLTV